MGGISILGSGGGGSLIDSVLEYGRAFFLAEARAYLRTVEAVEAHRGALVRVVRSLGELDASLAVAHIRETTPVLCTPRRSDGARLEARGLVHPLVDDARPNEVALGPRGLLVTGSNMAGKSTFLRTLGVNVLLAQTLGVACAEALSSPPLRVYASMGAEDDLAASVSLYQAEVLRLRALLEHAGATPEAPRCLFLLDEVFRGTNPRDRVAASCAVLCGLAEGNLVVAATHDLELADLTTGVFELGHFSERIDGDAVVFDYRLRPGLSRRTNALDLLERLGYPSAVVAHAEAVAARLTRARAQAPSSPLSR